MPIQIHRYPFLRLVAPLIAGIVCGDYLYNLDGFPPSGFFFILFAALGICLVILYLLSISYRFRWVFGILTIATFFSLGVALISWQLSKADQEFPIEVVTYRVMLIEHPVKNDKTAKCKVRLIARHDSLCSYFLDGIALLYLLCDTLSNRFQTAE